MNTIEANTKIELKSILYLTDFSEASRAALPFAIAIARQYRATMHTLHILVPEPFTYATPELGNLVMENQEQCAEESMSKVNAELTGVCHRSLVWRGLGVWESIQQVLAENPVDLIVLGTHGRTGAKRLLLGSAAEEIFRKSLVPVLTVGPQVSQKTRLVSSFRRILYATDFSDTAGAGLPYAISLAQENQAQLVLLHAITDKKADHSDTSVAEVMHTLDQLTRSTAKPAGNPECIVRFENADVAILSVAEQFRADLIVLGIRGDEGIPGGSTHLNKPIAHNVVCFAPCPVLTVRGTSGRK